MSTNETPPNYIATSRPAESNAPPFYESTITGTSPGLLNRLFIFITYSYILVAIASCVQ